MLTKSILTLAAASLATILIQTPAQASDLSHIVKDHRATVQVKVRDHRVTKQETIRDHRTARKNEVVKVSRKDCRVGAETLRRSGYRKIAMLDCQGTQYSYLAHKDHAVFGAKMNAYSGKIKVTFLGPVRSH